MSNPARTLVAVALLILTSCAAVPPIETPSGRPECTISGASNDQVQEYLLAKFMADGWMLQQQSTSQLVFWKENSNTMQNVLMGSQYDPTTTYEIRLVLSQGYKGAVRVFGQVALVSNEGSAFEKRNDLTTGKAGHELWQALVRVEQHFEEQPADPEPAS